MRNFNLLKAVILIDRVNRQNNYHAMVDRVEGHISRWESTIEKLQDVISRKESNIRGNEDRWSNAQRFLENMSSGKTADWLERQQRVAETHASAEKRSEASAKVADHHSRVLNAEQQIERIKNWINNDKDNIDNVKKKIADLEQKINNARWKL